MAPKKNNKPSNYTLLSKWLYDGSKTTEIPEDVVKDKSISQLYLLYYFQYSSYGLVINKMFNNYGIFNLDRVEVFKFLKHCVTLSGYRPPFIKRAKKDKTKMMAVLRQMYPYLRREEVIMLIDFIDESDEKDAIYETLGFYKPKKKKLTKAEKKRMEKESEEQKKEEVSLTSLMENFE
jgi:hypothetical protein